MAVPYTFATATSAIPLSNLDSNFATAITLGSTATYLGNTTTTIAGLTLTSPTLTTPALGTPSSGVLTNCTGYPASAVSGTLPVANGGTGVTTSTGTGNVVLSTTPTLVTPILGTPTSVTLTNATGLPLTTGVTGTLPVANGGTNLSSFTSGGVVYASSTSALATGSALTFNGTNLSTTGTMQVGTTLGVGATTPSASGAGITFPATQSASSNANTLDDYEEGTWTPVLTANTPGNLSVTYGTNGQQGYYTKVGRQVTLQCLIITSAFTYTTASSFVKITGLPFTSANFTAFENSSSISAFTGITKVGYTAFGFYVAANDSSLIGQASGSALAYDFLYITDLPTGTTKLFEFTLTYNTAT